MKKKELRERLDFQQSVNNALEDELSNEREYSRKLHRGATILERGVIVAAVLWTARWVLRAK